MTNWSKGLRKGLMMVCILAAVGTGCSTSKEAAKVDEGATTAPASKPDSARDKRGSETLVTSSADRNMPANQSVGDNLTSSAVIQALQRELQDIHFDFDKYDLTENARNILSQNAKILQGNTRVKVIVEGHCDERGTVEYNLALGEKRANSTRDYLVSLGIPSSRLQTVSYGAEKPVDKGHTDEAWAKNRRAHLLVAE